MKITILPLLLLTLLTSACSDATPPAAETPPSPATPAPNVPANPSAPVDPTPSPLVETKWSDIKDLRYDDRADVMAGLTRIQEKIDKQVADLKARRTALTTTDDPDKWNATMEVLGTACTRLSSAITDLGKATPQNWEQRHDRVADALLNVQDTYKKAANEAP